MFIVQNSIYVDFETTETIRTGVVFYDPEGLKKVWLYRLQIPGGRYAMLVAEFEKRFEPLNTYTGGDPLAENILTDR